MSNIISINFVRYQSILWNLWKPIEPNLSNHNWLLSSTRWADQCTFAHSRDALLDGTYVSFVNIQCNEMHTQWLYSLTWCIGICLVDILVLSGWPKHRHSWELSTVQWGWSSEGGCEGRPGKCFLFGESVQYFLGFDLKCGWVRVKSPQLVGENKHDVYMEYLAMLTSGVLNPWGWIDGALCYVQSPKKHLFWCPPL